jgi:hypothetical protein
MIHSVRAFTVQADSMSSRKSLVGAGEATPLGAVGKGASGHYFQRTQHSTSAPPLMLA